MATSENDWLNKRRRRTRCKRHGLHYDPSLTGGCVLCRKEGLEAEPQREGARLLPLLLSLLGLAVVAFQLSSAEFSSEVSPSSRHPPRVVHLSALPGIDAEPFRDSIGAVEEPLFASGSTGLADAASRAADGLRRLAGDLRARGEDTAALAANVEQLADTAPTTQVTWKSLTRLRTEWLLLRKDIFEPQPWFRQMPNPPDDPAAVVAWRDASTDLVDLLRSARSVIATAEGDDAAGEQWRSFTALLDERLAAIRDGLPPRPTTGQSDRVLAAVLAFERTWEGLQSLGRSPEPGPADRLAPLEDSAQEARLGFSSSLAG